MHYRCALRITIVQPKARYFFESFDEVCKRIPSLKSLTEWNIQILRDRLNVKRFIEPYTIPTYSIQIDIIDRIGIFHSSLRMVLPDNHEIYKLFKRNLRNVNFIDIVNKVVMYNICQALGDRDVRITNLELHSIPLHKDPLVNDYADNYNDDFPDKYLNTNKPFKSKTFY